MKKIPLNLPDNIYHRLQKLKKQDGYGGKTWSEWAAYLARDVHLTDSLREQIQANTRRELGKIWMQNLAENLPFVRRSGKCLRDLASQKTIKTPAIIVGAGPSIWQHKHLELLAERKFNGKIIATDRMLVPLLEHGVTVDFAVSIDGHAKFIPPFFDHDIVEESDVKVLLVLQTSPQTRKVCEKRGLNIYWFHTMQDDPRAENSSTRSIVYMTMSKKNPLGVAAVPSGGNCGATALAIAIDVLKHLNIALIGFDFGYPKGVPAEKTSYYSSIFKAMKKSIKDPTLASSQVLSSFTHFYHPVFKTEATSDPVFNGYRASLYEILSNLTRPCNVYNATEGGTLYNPTLFQCVTLDSFLSLIGNKE